MNKSSNITYVFGSKLIIFALTIAKGLLVPVYLGPKMYGVINLLNLVKTILGFTTFGVDKAYLRLRSGLLGEKAGQEEFRKLENTVFTILPVCALIGSIIIFLIPFFVRTSTEDLRTLMIFAFTVTAILHFISIFGSFYNITCVTQKRFVFISKLNVLQVLLNLILLLSTVFVWKIYGVFISELIAVLVVQVIYMIKSEIRPRIEFDWKEIKKVFIYAFPFSLTRIGFYFAQMIDKTIIAVYLSLGELGLYSFALNFTTQSRMLYKSVAEVLSPYFLEDMGHKSDAHHMSAMIINHSQNIAVVTALASFNAIYASDILGVLFGKYLDSVIVLKILLIHSYVSMVPIYQSLMLGSTGIRKQNLNNVAMVVAGLVNGLISMWLIKLGWGITGVAVGTLVATFVWQGLIMSWAHPYYIKGWNLSFYGHILFPLMFMVAAVYQSHQSSIFESKFTWITLVLGNLILFGLYRKQCREVFDQLKKFIRNRKNKQKNKE